MSEDASGSAFLAQLVDYRQRLLDQSGQMQLALDKNILTLSGGAIAVSFVFLDKAKAALGIEKFSSDSLLLLAWSCWALSVLVVLTSYFSSSVALAKAAELVDDRTIFLKWSKGLWNRLTKFLNPAAGILFGAGIVFLICFIKVNLPKS